MHEIEFCQQVVVNRSQLRISGYGNLNNYFVKKILTWINRIDRIDRIDKPVVSFGRVSSILFLWLPKDTKIHRTGGHANLMHRLFE